MANIESAIVCVDAGVAKLVQVREKQVTTGVEASKGSKVTRNNVVSE